MSNNFNNRYGVNSNLWRKTNSHVRIKPNNVNIVDLNTNVTSSINLNQYLRHRDLNNIEGYNQTSLTEPDWYQPTNLLQYEEGFVNFNNETEKTLTFTGTFDQIPIVVFVPVHNVNFTENINVFGTALPTKTQAFLGLSAPFTGQIRYIATYAPYYPWNPNSGSSTDLFAGQSDLANVLEYTSSYSLTASGSNYLYLDTIHQNTINYSINVGKTNDTVNNTTATNTLTNETTGRLNFITYRIA